MLHINALGHRVVAELFITRMNEVYPELAIPPADELTILE